MQIKGLLLLVEFTWWVCFECGFKEASTSDFFLNKNLASPFTVHLKLSQHCFQLRLKKNKMSNRASVAAVEKIKGENEMRRTEGLQGTL